MAGPSIQDESTAIGGESARQDGGAVLATVSNALVRLYKELFGRGPTKARSYCAGPDMLCCVLRAA